MKLKTLLTLLLLTAVSAFADFNFTLSPTLIQTPPGGLSDPDCFSGFCVIFSGTITVNANTPDTTTYYAINDLVVDFPGIQGAPNGDTYLSNGDCLGAAGGTNMCNYFFGAGSTPPTGPPPTFFPTDPDFNGGVFEIDVDPNTPAGTYFGTATLYGDVETDPALLGFATNFLGEQDFQIDVTPEPATFGLMLLGLAAGVAAYRRRAA